MKATTSLNIQDLQEMRPPPPKRLSREVTATGAFTFSVKNFVTQRVGTLSDVYEIGKKLGAGGYGEVFSCVHKETGIERAVKILEKSNCGDDDTCEDNEDVVREFNILKELDHPNILKQIEMLYDENHYYIVTEICRGGELLDEIMEWGNFIEEDSAELMRHLLGAVNYCHKQGVCHRDLKPENILLEENKDLDSIKIIDFGLAQVVEKDTEMNDLVGSIYYIAPEILSGSHTSKADIWSCGIIAYVLMAGYAPFDGHSDDDIKEEILSGEFSFNDDVWDDVSDQAKDFIATLLERDPKARPTAEEALKHPWIEENRMAASERLKQRESVNKRAMEALYNLGRFNAQSKLKQATYAFIASQLVLKEEKKKIDELFRALDINDNGKLTKDDVQIGYKEVFGKELADEMVEQMFKRIDHDNTGFIEYSEFVVATMNEKDLLSNDKLKHAFNMFDVDGSGYVTRDELVEVLTFFQEVDQTLDADVINGILKQVDEDEDGTIDFGEFTTMMFRTAEDAIVEESLREESQRVCDDPVVSEPTSSTNSTIVNGESQSAPEKAGAAENGPLEKPGRMPPMKRIPGAACTKSCLALFERNIQKNYEAGYESQIFTTQSKGITPIASARLSIGRAKRRASQENIQRIPTPVNRTRNSNGDAEPLDHKRSWHRPETTRDRASMFENFIKKKLGDNSDDCPPPLGAQS